MRGDDALDEACAKAGIPQANYDKAEPSLKRTLLQGYNVAARKKGKCS